MAWKPTTLGLSTPAADRQGAPTASPGCRATGASTVEQLRHLLIHSLLEGGIDLAGQDLGRCCCQTTQLLQACGRRAPHQLHLGLAVAGNDHLLTRESCFNQPRQLACGIEHVQERSWMRAVVASLTRRP